MISNPVYPLDPSPHIGFQDDDGDEGDGKSSLAKYVWIKKGNKRNKETGLGEKQFSSNKVGIEPADDQNNPPKSDRPLIYKTNH